MLAPLAKIADETGAAFLVVRHLNKSGGANALYRGGGSIGIVGAARMGYLAAKDPDDDGRRILAGTKCNIAAMPSALAYRLITDELHGCARLSWEGAVEVQTDDLLRPVEDPNERSERAEATDWLTDYLKTQGRSRSADVKKAARAAGIAERTLHRARRSLSVDVEQVGYPRETYWTPSQSCQSHPSRVSHAHHVTPQNPDTTDTTRDTTGTTGVTGRSGAAATTEPNDHAQSSGDGLFAGDAGLPAGWIRLRYHGPCAGCGAPTDTADPQQRFRHPGCDLAA